MISIRSTNMVKVFICSNCDSDEDRQNGYTKYSVMRKSLELLLKETNVCDVFVFEDGTSTSCDVEHSYINPLDDSDLIIVIIDNKDGVKVGTQKEINRAKALNKKCLYVFCDERENKITEIQNQLMTSAQNPRFIIAHEFADIPEKVYESVINDILSIYISYCRGRMDYTNDEVITGSSEITEEMRLSLAEDSNISKEFTSEFFFTRFIVKKEAGVSFEEEKIKSKKDRNCAELLGLVIGSPFTDMPDFDSIKQDVKQMHRGNMQKLVSIRYDAIEAYFGGELTRCIGKLEEAIEYIKKCKNIPKWVLNDTAIDLRNIQIEFDRDKNKIDFHTQGQNILDSDSEPLYYPVIDRIMSDYNEDIIRTRLKQATQSPYTVNFGGVDGTLGKACDAFIVAYFYGSLTHMLMTRKRLCDYLLGMTLEVRNHRAFVFTVRLLLLSGDEKNLKQFLNAYGENTNNINSADVENLLNGVDKQPIHSRRVLAKENMLRFFGYYYSDDTFEKESECIIAEVKNSIENGSAAGMLIKPILDAVEEVSYRFDEMKILELIFFLFEKDYRRYYNDIFLFLYRFHFTTLSRRDQKKYQSFMIKKLRNNDIRENNQSIYWAIQTLRQFETIDHRPLDNAVKKYNHSFYENTYCLNVEERDDKKGWQYIERFVEEINNDNQTQGVGGKYVGHSYSPFVTISNIIQDDNPTYNSRQIRKIVEAISGALYSKTQTIDAKGRALELLCVMQLNQPSNRQIKKLYMEIMERQDEVCTAKNILLVRGYNKTNLELYICLLGIMLKEKGELEVGIKLIGIQHSEAAEQITALSALNRLFKLGFLTVCAASAFELIFQFLLNESYNVNPDIRYYSMLALSKIKEKDYRDICLRRFVDIMDDEAYKGKVGLLYQLSEEEMKNPKVKYIFDKGRTDAHYWVRMAATRFDKKSGFENNEE